MKRIIHAKRMGMYFTAVYGSPQKKSALIKQIMAKYKINRKDILFVGDSNDDKDAARMTGIRFIGRITKHNQFAGLKSTRKIRDIFELNKLIDEKNI
jgi:phosphoglycolate phosphatase-like HAD superfamily hydrolase